MQNTRQKRVRQGAIFLGLGAAATLLASLYGSHSSHAQMETQAQAQPSSPTLIAIDAAAGKHSISPLIYGVAFASADDLKGTNATVNRLGGNNFSRYNWKVNTNNIDNDWYFESIAGWFLGTDGINLEPGHRADTFIADCKTTGAQPLITIPMLPWIAKVAPDKKTLYSFSVAKYGPQEKTAPTIADAGNGMKPDGKTFIENNDPNDANVPSTPEYQAEWIQHLVQKWGKADKGGVRYYIMDNEPGFWHGTHRDVHPHGMTNDEYIHDLLTYSAAVKSVDAKAQIIAPEEWGWPAYFQSGADGEYSAAHHYQGHPDKDAHGGMDFMPWILDQMHKNEQKTGKRLLDVFSLHIYPQGGDNNEIVTPKIQLLRNRSTRSLWDPNYKDESWVNNNIKLIPRMKDWVAQYYPGTKIGITEYSWGGETHINGATTQADILGIFGREDVYMASHWSMAGWNKGTSATTPVYKSFQMYRNYDGKKSTFGDVSISDTVPDPDTLSSFAAIRSSDKALTIMVIHKALEGTKSIAMSLSHFTGRDKAQIWQLTSANQITRLPDVSVKDGHINTDLPAQSITLLVIPAR